MQKFIELPTDERANWIPRALCVTGCIIRYFDLESITVAHLPPHESALAASVLQAKESFFVHCCAHFANSQREAIKRATLHALGSVFVRSPKLVRICKASGSDALHCLPLFNSGIRQLHPSCLRCRISFLHTSFIFVFRYLPFSSKLCTSDLSLCVCNCSLLLAQMLNPVVIRLMKESLSPNEPTTSQLQVLKNLNEHFVQEEADIVKQTAAASQHGGPVNMVSDTSTSIMHQFHSLILESSLSPSPRSSHVANMT